MEKKNRIENNIVRHQHSNFEMQKTSEKKNYERKKAAERRFYNLLRFENSQLHKHIDLRKLCMGFVS